MIIGRHARHTTRCAFKTPATYGFLLAVGAAFACLSALDSPRYSTLSRSPTHSQHCTPRLPTCTFPSPPPPPLRTAITHRHQDTLIRNCSPELSGSCTRCLGPRPHAAESRSPQRGPARNVPLRHASLAPCRRLSPSAKVTQFTQHAGKQAGRY
jgi:hypothetical protein